MLSNETLSNGQLRRRGLRKKDTFTLPPYCGGKECPTVGGFGRLRSMRSPLGCWVRRVPNFHEAMPVALHGGRLSSLFPAVTTYRNFSRSSPVFFENKAKTRTIGPICTDLWASRGSQKKRS